jgi:UDP-2,3-diacylglucosamine hydrolase
MDVTPEEVVRLLSEHKQHLMVHGHTHRPAIHDLDIHGEPGKRIVLGDWDKKGWYLEITPAGFRLQDFVIE